MSLSYAWQKFHSAILSLSDSQAFDKRIINAINSLHTLNKDDLPDEVKEEFEIFWKNMTSVESIGEEGTIAATVNTLSEEQLIGVSRQIVSMHDTICRMYGYH